MVELPDLRVFIKVGELAVERQRNGEYSAANKRSRMASLTRVPPFWRLISGAASAAAGGPRRQLDI